MLSERYQNDGLAAFHLNGVQKAQRATIRSHIADGTYAFEEVPCSVCNGESLEDLAQKDRYGIFQPVAICTECGLVQASPRMTQESYNHFYNDGHRRLYVGTDVPTDSYFEGRYRAGKTGFEFISKHTVVKGKKVLEVGCGAGAILKYFHDNGAIVRGIDLSQEYLSYGRDRYGLDLECVDLLALQDSREFDIVIYSDVLEHILDPRIHLRKLKGLLKDDGLLYVKVPGLKNTFKPCRGDFLRSLQSAHVSYFSLSTLKNLMSTCGFAMRNGDEEIRSLWRVSDGCETVENDYAAAMAYLRRLEKRWISRRLFAAGSGIIKRVKSMRAA